MTDYNVNTLRLSTNSIYATCILSCCSEHSRLLKCSSQEQSTYI